MNLFKSLQKVIRPSSILEVLNVIKETFTDVHNLHANLGTFGYVRERR